MEERGAAWRQLAAAHGAAGRRANPAGHVDAPTDPNIPPSERGGWARGALARAPGKRPTAPRTPCSAPPPWRHLHRHPPRRKVHSPRGRATETSNSRPTSNARHRPGPAVIVVLPPRRVCFVVAARHAPAPTPALGVRACRGVNPRPEGNHKAGRGQHRGCMRGKVRHGSCGLWSMRGVA